MRIIILIAACVVFSGCTTVQTAVETIPVSERQYDESYEKVFSTALEVIGAMELKKGPYPNKDKGQISAALPHYRISARDVFSTWLYDVIVINVIDLGDRTQVDMRIIYNSNQQDWSDYIARFFAELSIRFSQE
jgi:hypothetical protein